jgi:hypothetical protein
MSAPSRQFVRYRPVREDRVDDVLFLIDQEGKAIHALSPIGAGIWSLLLAPASIAETKRILKQAFPNVPARRIALDVDEIFSEFEEFGLIRHVR